MSKLEPRLQAAIEQSRSRAVALGQSAERVNQHEAFTVTVLHQESVLATEAPNDRLGGLEDLKRRAEASEQPVISLLREIGVEVRTVHTLANAVTARLTPQQMERVAELDEVKRLTLEAPDQVTCMNESPLTIEVPQAWEDFDAQGRGIKVAVLDSGVDANHPALAGKVVDNVSTAGEGTDIPGEHGTHVAGTIASNDPVFRGVAFHSEIINIKVLTSTGFGEPQFVIDGLEQAVRRGAHVANLSLGWSEPFHSWVCDDADCILCRAADNASRLGVTVVVAAGNEDSFASDGQSNIRHPGAARNVITVGAIDKAKMLADFSSTGPSSGRLSPGSGIRLTKPDLAAPGVSITSAILNGTFAPLSGTSMASPHVAGVAALISEADPALLPRMIKKLLEDTSEPLPFGPNQVGYGSVNAYAALLRTRMK
ncbi:S8 family peptidase [Saccharopolyspora elongata]|uniref:Peptidase S8/S53 domain-containing protein n=1 Tax=Saccharopolyspora elongata TaxID=2530387 RepID=A0A4R4YEA3_9PSEU|nr:S8 family serine peptidase [Saccharopolyspora elongata]TDD42440.1 hypothetical protein E1288_29395 [Saccharopolyspora elongata]